VIIIAGLGNPGREYAPTRHNVGFDTIDVLANKYNIKMNKLKFKGVVGEGIVYGQKVLLLKPCTYMNNSGVSVREAVQFYKVELKDLLVVYDDIDIQFGTIRIRQKGSGGSHNGMKSIIYHLGEDTFPRIKIGIGKKPENYDLADFVLSKFTTDERKVINQTISNAALAADSFIKDGIDYCMNNFNIKTTAQD